MKKTLILIGFPLIVQSLFALTYQVTVPGGTKACYIAGEMNNWSQQAMNKVDNTHYQIDIASATTNHKYKYCSGPDWTYVENIADNRSYTTNDVVSSWAAVYDPLASPEDVVYTVSVPLGTTACYFAGTATAWTHKPMARLDNNHFTITINTANRDGYKYCSGPDWAYEEINADGQSIQDRSYQSSDNVNQWKQMYYSSAVGISYNVKVPSGTSACFLSGEFNNWGFTSMTRMDDTHFMASIPNATPGNKYLYYSGPAIGYKELNSTGGSVPNRSYKPFDEVSRWSSVYQPTSSIQLISEFEYQSYECGATVPISWKSENVQQVKIFFSGDYGLNWDEITTAVPASTGKFDWVAPTTPWYQCRIMICDASNSLVNAVSKGMFIIHHQLAEKVDPLLKTNYQVFIYPYNSKYPATDAGDSENINGKVGNACGPTAVSNILAYWEFPRKGFGSRSFIDHRNCLWSASFQNTEYNYDLSNDRLTPNSPSNLIDANATLMYHAGVAMHDTYRSGNSQGVLNAFKQYFGYNAKATELNRDDYSPEQWEKIIKSELSLGRPQIVQGWANILGSGGYGGHWFMCDGYSADNLFHINLDYGSDGKKYCPLYAFDAYKMKNWIFAYLEPEKNNKHIQLQTPSGGENWQQGSVKNIRWTVNGVATIRIELSDNGGESWSTLADNVPASSGSFELTLPVKVSTSCKIRISDVSDINIYSRNKQNFSIYDEQSLGLATSVASTVQSGTILPIRWTSKGIKNVTLEYTLNEGQNWNFIAELNAELSCYKWTVPGGAATGCKIRISDASNHSLSTESQSFSISSNAIVGGPYAMDEHTLALYHFDGDYTNTANSQLSATPFNTTQFSANSENKLDYALRIDNTNVSVSSCVVLPHENTLSLTGDWTLECWFKINSWGGPTTAFPFLFIKSGANYFIFLDVTAKTLQVGYDYNGGAETLNLPSNSLETNKWYHVQYTRNTANSTLNCRLYDANRKEVISKSINYNPAHIPKITTDPINIGGFSGGSNVQFDGFIDEVRISNVVRSYIATGINQINENQQYSIYPNPTTGIINIHLQPQSGFREIVITGTSGQIIYSKKTTQLNDVNVDLSALARGIYFIQFIDEQKQVKTDKLILY